MQKAKGLASHIAALKAMNGKFVETGWFETNKYMNGIPVAQVAYWNEYGTRTAPARPFLRYARTKFRKTSDRVISKLVDKVLSGQLTPVQAMNQIGMAMEVEIVDSIKNGGWVGNSEITIHGTPPDKNGEQFIKGKGFDKPLIGATGTMWQTVVSKVS